MKRTDTILDQIVTAKRAELEEQKRRRPLYVLEHELAGFQPDDVPSFFEAVKAGPTVKLIAEIKRASPSAGVLRRPFSLEEINNAYQAAPSVVAISVLTEREHFQGGSEALEYVAAHNRAAKPLLRKDFIFDPYQVAESKLLGASAFLLIAALFDGHELAESVDRGFELGVEPLVEVHDERELELVLGTQARCIGVNSRNLRTFEIDNRRHEMLRWLDDSYVRVAESGIDNAGYLAHLSTFADAALVGSRIMQAADIGAAISDLTRINTNESKRHH